mgnify:CR=1 FL=1
MTKDSSQTDDSIIDLDDPIDAETPGRNWIVWTAKLLNIVFAGCVLVILAVNIHDARRSELLSIGVCALFFAVLNLIALHETGKGSSWLSLYLKRRKLEEQKRIKELEKELG